MGGSVGRRSTGTKSISVFSGPSFSARSAANSGNDGVRLVGLSQPFFVSSTPNDDVFEGEMPEVRQSTMVGGKKVMTPVTEVTTPGTTGGERETKLIGITRDAEKLRDIQKLKAQVPPAVHENETMQENEKVGMVTETVVEKDTKIRVLVVEDNKINQKLVVKVLQLEGVKEVTVAEDGGEAIDRVKDIMERQLVFDIIFMDIQVCTRLVL